MNQRTPSISRKHRALALFRAGQLAQAKTLYEEISEADRRDADAWYMLGTIHGMQGESKQAASCLRKVIELRPTHALAFNDLGLELNHQGRGEEAIKCYKKALQLQPDLALAHCNLGSALYATRNFDESVISCQRALQLGLEHHEVHNALGLALHALGKFDDALACYRRALQVNPDYPEAYNNAGSILSRQGKYQEGLAYYHKALRFKPDFAEAHSNISSIELALGHFSKGWSHYVYRSPLLHSSRIMVPPSARLPQNLSGRRILLGQDQGIGDELFFLRFLPQLKARGAWVAYCPVPKIASMLARVEGIDRLVASDEPLEAIDYTFSVGDLPLLLGMDNASKIPPPLKLAPLPEQVETITRKLSILGPAPHIGVTWRAGTKDNNNFLYKETPKAQIAAALKPLGATVVVIQRLPQQGEIETFSQALGRPAHDVSALNEDIEQMLALLSLLDDYVGVSNTNMHLRAGLGKTARVLVPHPPEWRWMTEGSESPWFRGFAVYRQGVGGDWREAFGRLKQDLVQSFPSP